MNEKTSYSICPLQAFQLLIMGNSKCCDKKLYFLQLMNEKISYSVCPLQAFPLHANACG